MDRELPSTNYPVLPQVGGLAEYGDPLAEPERPMQYVDPGFYHGAPAMPGMVPTYAADMTPSPATGDEAFFGGDALRAATMGIPSAAGYRYRPPNGSHYSGYARIIPHRTGNLAGPEVQQRPPPRFGPREYTLDIGRIVDEQSLYRGPARRLRRANRATTPAPIYRLGESNSYHAERRQNHDQDVQNARALLQEVNLNYAEARRLLVNSHYQLGPLPRVMNDSGTPSEFGRRLDRLRSLFPKTPAKAGI